MKKTWMVLFAVVLMCSACAADRKEEPKQTTQLAHSRKLPCPNRRR